jgi:7-cyano-7-deazaguanine synthase in queuosine biosynthesis
MIEARISDRRLSQAFAAELSPRVSDLLDIAGAVYKADRLVRRPRARGQTFGASHRRELSVELPVRDTEFWDGEADPQLRSVLDWLTGDRWNFRYLPYASPRRPAEAEQHLFSAPLGSGSEIALFSGGLDALAGAALLLEEVDACAFVAVGTNPRQIRCQATLVRELRRRYPGFVGVPVSASLTGAKGAPQERSQRSRGFLFLAIATAAAHAADAAMVNMCENGIGAMNLPYSERQIGIDTSRAAHPETLHRMGQLAESVLGRQILIRNPLFSMTKAEACRLLPAEWLPLIRITVSCDIGFTDRRHDPALCGACASCLLRRQALHGSGLGDIDLAENYRFDILRGGAEGEAFRAMRAQARRFARTFASWDDLLAAVPDVEAVVVGLLRSRAVANELQAQATVQRLLATYVAEWRFFPALLAESATATPVAAALAEAV